MGYTFVGHTADLGVVINGETVEELMQSALDALRDWSFSHLSEERSLTSFEISGETETDLWFRLLNELIFLMDKNSAPLKLNLREYHVGRICYLRCDLEVAPNSKRSRGIKAFTLHKFGFSANLVFDV
ncbi:archease [Coprothermobacteraceae bacterium]|nr:archease [Coprothermobacteraceae bacterium]